MYRRVVALVFHNTRTQTLAKEGYVELNIERSYCKLTLMNTEWSYCKLTLKESEHIPLGKKLSFETPGYHFLFFCFFFFFVSCNSRAKWAI